MGPLRRALCFADRPAEMTPSASRARLHGPIFRLLMSSASLPHGTCKDRPGYQIRSMICRPINRRVCSDREIGRVGRAWRPHTLMGAISPPLQGLFFRARPGLFSDVAELDEPASSRGATTISCNAQAGPVLFFVA